jgi:hypothetical protein
MSLHFVNVFHYFQTLLFELDLNIFCVEID